MSRLVELAQILLWLVQQVQRDSLSPKGRHKPLFLVGGEAGKIQEQRQANHNRFEVKHRRVLVSQIDKSI